MYVLLLAGGSGKRLWPLSNEVRSKQFLKPYQNESYNDGTMISHIYRQIKQVNPTAKILIATNTKQIGMLRAILDKDIEFCIEPEQKDTFPAISLAIRYLYDIKGVPKSEVVIVCPIDIDADCCFFQLFPELERLVLGGENLGVIGVTPDFPSNQFAYILTNSNERTCSAISFIEKPSIDQARLFMRQGALWSGGIYAFQLGYLLNKISELVSYQSYHEIYSNYSILTKRSFAYTIAEKEKQIKVIRYNGRWKDIGNWETFSGSLSAENKKYVITDEQCRNVRIINELHIPVVCMGCTDMIIVASAGGILVSSLKDCTNIKPYVEKLSQQVMFAERTWGSFLVLDIQKESLTIKITLLKGHNLNYHSHSRREEVWTIISGTGITVIEGQKKKVGEGDTIRLPVECKHTIFAVSNMKIIEVQLGKDISVEDKYIYSL